MDWPHLLANITGRVDQELLLRNEYWQPRTASCVPKSRVGCNCQTGRKSTLAEIARRLGCKALADVAAVARPDIILRWSGKLVARKFDGSRFR